MSGKSNSFHEGCLAYEEGQGRGSDKLGVGDLDDGDE